MEMMSSPSAEARGFLARVRSSFVTASSPTTERRGISGSEIKKSGWERIGTKTLYKGSSDYTTLKVQKKRGTISLISGGKFVQSSYRPSRRPLGTVWDHFLLAPLFAPKPDEVKDVCILGLGAGVAVKLLNRTYEIERMVGVEIDRVVVDLGRRFFDLNDNNLEVRIQDAAEYVKESLEKPACRQAGFDLILIDAFKDDEVDSGCSCLEFYSNAVKLLKPGGIVLANRANTKKQEKTNKKFLSEFPRLFAQCYALNVKNNIFYFGLQKPLKKQEIIERMRGLAAEGEFTRFLKGLNFEGKRAMIEVGCQV